MQSICDAGISLFVSVIGSFFKDPMKIGLTPPWRYLCLLINFVIFDKVFSLKNDICVHCIVFNLYKRINDII